MGFQKSKLQHLSMIDLFFLVNNGLELDWSFKVDLSVNYADEASFLGPEQLNLSTTTKNSSTEPLNNHTTTVPSCNPNADIFRGSLRFCVLPRAGSTFSHPCYLVQMRRNLICEWPSANDTLYPIFIYVILWRTQGQPAGGWKPCTSQQLNTCPL